MAGSSAKGDFLTRAEHVFSSARELGCGFREDKLGHRGLIDHDSWNRHAPAFEQFCDALGQLRDPIQNPPVGLEAIAAQLKKAAETARRIRDTRRKMLGELYPHYADFFPELYSVAEDGLRAVRKSNEARGTDDTLAVLDELAERGEPQRLTCLDRYPDTPAGHIAFLEFVRDEVHGAAAAKRGGSNGNATLASMVGGIHWREAHLRLVLLSSLPPDAVEQVARVLRRQLTIGTVERIDELLTPVIVALRDTWEDSRDNPELSNPFMLVGLFECDCTV
jgi:hypothetical protein